MLFWKVTVDLWSKSEHLVRVSVWVGLLGLGLVGSSGLRGVQAVEITDATKVRVKVSDHPIRMVTLAPSLAELAADLVGMDLERIVGVSEFTDYPPGLRKVPSIGPYTKFNLEKVVALKPDLVLGTLDGNSKDQVVHLRELGIPVVIVETGDFREIENSIRLVASAVGSVSRGEKMASQLREGISRLRERAKVRPKTKVLLQIGDDPIVVVGGKTFLQSALEVLGASNIYEDSKIHYPRPSLEDIIQRDPEVIVVIALGEDLKPFSRMAKKWEQFRNLRAVKNRRVQVLRCDALIRPTLRILEGLKQLEHLLYGKK